MSKNKIVILISAIILLVIFLGVFAFFLQKERNETIGPKIVEQLLIPYSKLLNEQKFEEAYKLYTSDYYKAKHSLKEFVTKQQENLNEFGAVKNIEPLSGIFLKEKHLAEPWIFKSTLKYECENSSIRIEIDVINENDKFLIYRTYRSFTTIKSTQVEIF